MLWKKQDAVRRIKGLGQWEESYFRLGGWAKPHWGSNTSHEPRRQKILCTRERREGVFQADTNIKCVWSLKVKILGEVSSWEKASVAKVRERMVRNLGEEEGRWGLLGWGKECDLYPKWHGKLLVLCNQGTCLMCYDKSPQDWAQERKQVRTAPRVQRLASPKKRLQDAGMQGDVFWRYSWQKLLMALEVGGGGRRKSHSLVSGSNSWAKLIDGRRDPRKN